MQASPDYHLQDGASQSAITIEARGPNSQPARGVTMRVDMAVGGARWISARCRPVQVVTGDDGRARVTYTAPPRPAISGGTGSVVTLYFSPMTAAYRGDTVRQVDVKVIPPGTILPPNGAPVADFSLSPTAPATFQTVSFDASNTQDEGVLCGVNCSYSWTFGDGGSGSGQIRSHEYRTAGTFVRDAPRDRRRRSNRRCPSR